jgi:hypothetical protein
MVERAEGAGSAPPDATKRDHGPARTRGGHAKKTAAAVGAGTAHTAKSGGKGAAATSKGIPANPFNQKNQFIDLDSRDITPAFWAPKTTSQVSGSPANRTENTARPSHQVSARISGQASGQVSGPASDNPTPIEKQIDGLKKKLRIPAGRDLQTEINNRLGRLVSGDKSTDKAINNRIAELEIARRGKGHFERLGPNSKIEQLRYLKELRTLVNKADGLNIWAKELTGEITALKNKVSNPKVPRAERIRCSAEATAKSDQLAAINETLRGHPEPKDEEALVASSNRMDALSYGFAHPDKHFVKADDLREQLNGMQTEFRIYGKLSTQLYKSAKGAEEYFAFMRSNLHNALTDLRNAGRMNRVRMEDIKALRDQIDQLDPNNPKPAARPNTPAPHTSPLVDTLPR